MKENKFGIRLLETTFVLTLVGLFVLGYPFPASTANYPVKPVRVIVPFPAGSSSDTMMRIMAKPMSQGFGQPVVVENIPGGDGSIAASDVRRAAPDGYTLLMATTSPLTAVPIMRKNPPYDPIADFTPISYIGTNLYLVLVNPKVPAKTLAEFLDYARANPGKLNYATGSITGIIATAQLMSMGGINMLHVPYKGEVPAIPDLISGRIHFMISGLATTLPFVKDGRLRALATAYRTRTSLLPEVPNIAEAGMPRFSISPWAGMFGPAKMARDVVDRINREVNAALKMPEVLEQIKPFAWEVAGSTPEELGVLLKNDLEAWGRITREYGIKPE